MKIAVYQMEIVPGDIQANMKKVAEWIGSLQDVDIAVLPEMWNVSYVLDEFPVLIHDEGQQETAMLQQLAVDYHINIVGGSIAVKVEGRFRNRAVVINRNGEIVYQYDKMHLVPMLDEPEYLEAGNCYRLFELEGRQMGVIICYDLRFPEMTRTLALNGMEVLFVTAEWPESRIDHFTKLNYARAIENQCYVIACNAGGQCRDTVFGGRSMTISPLGEVIAEAGRVETVIEAELEAELTAQVRWDIPVFSSRRPELY